MGTSPRARPSAASAIAARMYASSAPLFIGPSVCGGPAAVSTMDPVAGARGMAGPAASDSGSSSGPGMGTANHSEAGRPPRR